MSQSIIANIRQSCETQETNSRNYRIDTLIKQKTRQFEISNNESCLDEMKEIIGLNIKNGKQKVLRKEYEKKWKQEDKLLLLREKLIQKRSHNRRAAIKDDRKKRADKHKAELEELKRESEFLKDLDSRQIFYADEMAHEKREFEIIIKEFEQYMKEFKIVSEDFQKYMKDTKIAIEAFELKTLQYRYKLDILSNKINNVVFDREHVLRNHEKKYSDI